MPNGIAPARHKGQWRGKARTIYLGPRAQEVIAPFLAGRAVDQYLFSPAEAEAERQARKREARKSHPSCNKSRDARRRERADLRRRAPGERYNTNAIGRAIRRACAMAQIPEWSPHQIRHAAATKLRKEYGLEAAALVLGHASATLTDAVYAERDAAKIEAVVAKIG
ncbi:MAG: tyrosine-type recombinase/integrase [Planctomycetota bacterium]